MKNYLPFIVIGVLLSSCSNENIKYASNEDEATALMKECDHNPNIDYTKLSNSYQLSNMYSNNCNPRTSPETALYIGINPYYRQ